jgi:hypothetical protein
MHTNRSLFVKDVVSRQVPCISEQIAKELDSICDGMLQGCNGLIYGKSMSYKRTFMEGHSSLCFITIITRTFVSLKAEWY